MPDLSARLNLPYLAPAQAQKHVTHNEALALLDALVQTGIVETDAADPPVSPANGALYALGAAPTGDWAGQAGMLALWQDAGWRFLPPQTGWRAWDLAQGQLIVFDGSAWISALPSLDAAEGLGIGTSWDAVNRLAVASEASLLTHDGAGHQMKINKASAADTASLLFQSNWTGHAEMGLAGDTGFSVKVSADGSAWTDALAIDPATGIFSGAAIQQSADDATPGRLMRADWGYGPATILGAVSQSGGQPTGAVIERGSSGSGAFTRFADGTQICWARADLVYDAGNRLEYTWTYPSPFSNVPVLNANLENEFGATPGPTQLHGPFARQGASPSTTACTIRLYRSDDAPDFQNGDTLPVHVFAVGRWF